ncbi:Phage tail component protein [Paragonimus heterotremus]|uniref:Phage tail component protein n=1 Tax=Paragonimus heterotremus TaxID=100268 RepID=A0A8J4SKT9_9TREM|nr:Phage tail component protein [Paragonimus heterotremus]
MAESIQATDKMKSEQSSCLQSAKHCRTYIQFLLKEIAKIDKCDDSVDQKELVSLRDELQRKEILLRDVDDSLPRNPGIYLRIVLGALNISFLSKQDKFAYKNDYEQFKIVVSGISAVLAFLLYFFIKSRYVCSTPF